MHIWHFKKCDKIRMKYIISSLLTVQWRQAYPHGCVTVTHVSRFIAFDFKVHLSSSIYMSSSCISALSQALQRPSLAHSTFSNSAPPPLPWRLAARPSESCSCVWSPNLSSLEKTQGWGEGLTASQDSPQATIPHTSMDKHVFLHIVLWRHDHKACIYVLFRHSCCGKSDVLNISSA